MKEDLPPNAVFPGSPVAPSSNFEGGGSSEKGGENLIREKRQSEFYMVEKMLKGVSRKDVETLSVKTHSGVFDFDRFQGDSPERWATSNPNTNYTCDSARLIVWKNGGNEFGNLNQEMYKTITV